MFANNFKSGSRFERSLAKKDSESIVKNRLSLLGYLEDDSDGGGSGDALNSIFAAIGAGASVYAASASQGRTGYPGPAPVPSPVYSSYSAHASSMGSSSLLWIVLLLLVGFFAFKKL